MGVGGERMGRRGCKKILAPAAPAERRGSAYRITKAVELMADKNEIN